MFHCWKGSLELNSPKSSIQMYVPYIAWDSIALAYFKMKRLLCFHGCWLLDELGGEQRSSCEAALCLCVGHRGAPNAPVFQREPVIRAVVFVNHVHRWALQDLDLFQLMDLQSQSGTSSVLNCFRVRQVADLDVWNIKRDLQQKIFSCTISNNPMSVLPDCLCPVSLARDECQGLGAVKVFFWRFLPGRKYKDGFYKLWSNTLYKHCW